MTVNLFTEDSQGTFYIIRPITNNGSGLHSSVAVLNKNMKMINLATFRKCEAFSSIIGTFNPLKDAPDYRGLYIFVCFLLAH